MDVSPWLQFVGATHFLGGFGNIVELDLGSAYHCVSVESLEPTSVILVRWIHDPCVVKPLRVVHIHQVVAGMLPY